MKLVNLKVNGEVRLGIKLASGILDVANAAAACNLPVPTAIDQVIADSQKQLPLLAKLAEQHQPIIPEENITYAPCVTKPEKIICIGLNYLNHREECKKLDIPSTPIIFSKFNNALAAHNQTISLPTSARKFDYEAELVIVIGKEAVDVSTEEALSYVFGYTVGNDLSARDLQVTTSQWLLGKTCDHFAPVGPYIVTADEIDPANLDIQCKVNGELRQSANTSDMIFDCAAIISYISRHMTLKPGDIIFSGTPGGVILGYPEDKQQWLQSGDEVIVTIEKLGSLRNVLA
jgi:2-keto-4-pentenoate hydratase/2-oxohepta-3-ene-1,7-dioic acid hydratase in catechol pathway